MEIYSFLHVCVCVCISIEAMLSLLPWSSLHILGIISFLKGIVNYIYFQILDYHILTKIRLRIK